MGEPGSPPRVSWFGHAAGRRADGLSSYSATVVAGLRRRGCPVHFHHAARDGDRLPQGVDDWLAWSTWRFKTLTFPAPGFRTALRRRLAQERPEIVHCSLSFSVRDALLAEAAHAVGAAAVVTFHLPFARAGSARGRVLQALYRFWAPRLRAYDRVIVFSPEQRARLTAAGVDPERCVVIPNAVDTAAFCPGPSPLRAGPLRGAQQVIGYAGRLDPEKRVDRLLQAFARAALPPDTVLLLAGDGQGVRAVERAAAASRRVVYLGRLDTEAARIAFWRAVDCFCLPSTAEGLSLALLEAMACGCAVLATPMAGAAVAGPGGRTLAPGGGAAELATALTDLCRDPAELTRLGDLARDQAVRHHGVEPMLDQLLQVYRVGRRAGERSG
ncbi:MAG TPA: glycosyltransferase family 4 protein [Candidatus Dormibacteraeota bacterium]|nr:glycosyltransferase family 4 protein [Candidatus Dormibacteraeota bacterium]